MAQQVRFSPDATEECLKKQRTPGAEVTCIGESARACFQRIKNASPSDIAACMGQESEYWTARMTAAHDRLMVLAKAADADFAKNPKSKDVPFSLTEDLEIQQQKWAEWREIRCAVEAMMRRGTPYTTTAAGNCTMKRIGEQALFLESAVKYMETK
ncbi:lysozyme inhibitor LprI family protein [Rhodovulum sp.]|uniref:lysozyme inhibitor LprI family protein n=1 Tax=Rhodovulum sp. TaxID=34009 RepID=UPI00257CCEB7|nr:lysozyme inhibitor LprI family protein [Rhodovulum sp.]